MNKLKNFLECGHVNKHSKDAVVLIISNFKDIYDKIIPLFKKYHILGIKSLDFEDFCKVAEIKNNKNHLTLNGLNKIKKKKIKIGMNRNRILSKYYLLIYYNPSAGMVDSTNLKFVGE
jgi:hypothetical protein